ncbi:ParA family protein [Paenibacillus agricola]|uniref:ParA family protein n=1 Tax=Paenibacillus agricola TaxID=2716264 RepID=A0ABX0JJ71_9BACL|nr:ParA family protein [Paenibacillus agricola]NHN35386.1 ParA family protein [Paenibacillus agricola]
MAITIAVAIQKGGSGKSTTAGILSHMLSQKYKTLAVDMDGQGNLSQLLTGIEDLYEINENTVYHAIKDLDAAPHIRKLTDNLDLLTGDQLVNTLASYIYLQYFPKTGDTTHLLKIALSHVIDQYDYIIIDCPPALGELMYNSLTAADFVIAMFETSKFCYSSLISFFESLEHVRENTNPNLKIAGILRTMIDNRRSDNKYFCERVEKEFGDLCFKTIIQRTAVVGRLPAYGITTNPEMKQIMKQYKPVLEELMKIVEVPGRNGQKRIEKT